MMRENDGFRIFYWFLKDALLYRVSVLMVDVEEIEKTRRDVVERWTEEQMAMAEELAIEQGATEVTFEVTRDAAPTVAQGYEAAMEQGAGPGLPVSSLPTFSGTITVTRKKKRVVIDNVAPEDLRVSPADCRDI